MNTIGCGIEIAANACGDQIGEHCKSNGGIFDLQTGSLLAVSGLDVTLILQMLMLFLIELSARTVVTSRSLRHEGFWRVSGKRIKISRVQAVSAFQRHVFKRLTVPCEYDKIPRNGSVRDNEQVG